VVLAGGVQLVPAGLERLSSTAAAHLDPWMERTRHHLVLLKGSATTGAHARVCNCGVFGAAILWCEPEKGCSMRHS
jgi:hypothetical protein